MNQTRPAFDKDLTHVRDIEHPGRLADGVMLVHDARVLHGELPAVEVDELAARKWCRS